MAVMMEEQLVVVKVGSLALQWAVGRERLWVAQTAGLLEAEMVASRAEQLVREWVYNLVAVKVDRREDLRG